MKAIVIPVKAFAQAKSRLAPGLSAAARAELAEALCADTFGVISRVGSTVRVYVISNEARALQWARERGWETIPESHQVSESASVDRVSRIAQESGIGTLLRIPADLPLLQSADVEMVLDAETGSPGCVIVPSRDGTGTNALLRSPPLLFPSFFGPGSFVRHVTAAASAGVAPIVLRNARIELDIDEAADLELLQISLGANDHIARWLNERDRDRLAESNPFPIPKQHPL